MLQNVKMRCFDGILKKTMLVLLVSAVVIFYRGYIGYAKEETTQGTNDKFTETNIEKKDAELQDYVSIINCGDEYLKKYRNNKDVSYVILVSQSLEAESTGTLSLYYKDGNGEWVKLLNCDAFLGVNGIDKKEEGDGKTPTGDYGVGIAFGIESNPGSKIEYIQVTDSMYYCADKEYYNKLIDTAKVEHECSTTGSEHLIDHIPGYNYALVIDYNKECVFNKGSAIFLHCFSEYPYTMGCISISEENMIKIIQTVDKNVRICIFREKAVSEDIKK